MPAEIRDAAYAQNADNPNWTGHIQSSSVVWKKLKLGVPQHPGQTFRVAFGTRGSFGNIDYDWYYQYGKSERDQRSALVNSISLAFQEALDAERYDANGNIVCSQLGLPARLAACQSTLFGHRRRITPEPGRLGAVSP